MDATQVEQEGRGPAQRPRPFVARLRDILGFPQPPDPEAGRAPIPLSRFIPLSRHAVMANLCHEIRTPEETKAFAMAALRLERHRNHDYRLLAQEMRRVYLPFSPDNDTVKVEDYPPDEREEMEARLAELTTHLLTRANYTELSTEEINEILNVQQAYSLHIEVDLSEYDLLQVFVRDVYLTKHEVRRPETAYILKYTYDSRIYRRLFVLLKLKSAEDKAAELVKRENIPWKTAMKRVLKRRKHLPQKTSADNIYIKVFKDMPEDDLQILFPLRTVQFRPFDKMKFYATAGGGTLFGIFSTTGKVVAATNPIAALGALAGFGGLLARQISGFFNQRTRYMMELSQKLFFHNLANNRAALTLLLDRAEEEDVKEDLILLYFLAGETIEEGDLAERKARIEATIMERYSLALDFEIDDALRRLLQDGVVRRDGTQLTFASFGEAAAHYEALAKADDCEEIRHFKEDHDAVITESVEANEA